MNIRLIALTIAWSALVLHSPVLAKKKNKSSDNQSEEQTTRKYGALLDPYPSTYQAYPSQPILIRGAIIYDGRGNKYENKDILLENGKIQAIGEALSLPEGGQLINAQGKWVTPGIIDAHSHMGVYASPDVWATRDGNEVTGPVRAEVWAEHSVWPQDPQFSRALAGGVTSLQILPGSADLFGGRSITLKNVYSRSVQGMKFPGAPYNLKMACGENPKRVYGNRKQMPGSRMANFALDRQTWAAAQEYKKSWEAWSGTGSKKKRKTRAKGTPPSRNLQLETLALALDGKIRIHNHCYRADEMAQVIDMAKEFGYKVAAFHHAVESYKIADLLAKADICSAMWADWWGFKLESYDAVRANAALVHQAGACAIIHSDDPHDVQRLNQETAKAIHYGEKLGIAIKPEEAWTWLSYNPAKSIGIEKQTGSLEPGKMADVVLWNGDPFSVYTRAEKVWIDGALLYDSTNPNRRPLSDFELGQPGAGDVK